MVSSKKISRLVPNRGDIYWLSLDPAVGHEQMGKRLVVVVSSANVHSESGMALVVPITSRARGYSTEVVVVEAGKVGGVALVTQARFVDWKKRIGNKAGTCPNHALRQIQSHLLGVIVNDL